MENYDSSYVCSFAVHYKELENVHNEHYTSFAIGGILWTMILNPIKNAPKSTQGNKEKDQKAKEYKKSLQKNKKELSEEELRMKEAQKKKLVSTEEKCMQSKKRS